MLFGLAAKGILDQTLAFANHHKDRIGMMPKIVCSGKTVVTLAKNFLEAAELGRAFIE